MENNLIEYNTNGVRKESTFVRSKMFSKWIRDNLPSSKDGFCVADMDYLLWNYKTKRMMILEEKCGTVENNDMNEWFKIFIRKVFTMPFYIYCKSIGVEYRGYHEVRFIGGLCPDDAKFIFLDRKIVTKEELTEYLSMTSKKNRWYEEKRNG